MKELKVSLKKNGANTLERNSEGVWILDGKVIDHEQAIVEMAEAVNDLQEAYEYHAYEYHEE